MRKSIVPVLSGIIVFSSLFGSGAASGAPRPDLWPRWEKYGPESLLEVDHGPWDRFLAEYVNTAHPSGVHRVRYASVSKKDSEGLVQYISSLGKVPVSELNRQEQRAYWINLYNALTVKIILDHYPVGSIRDIDISPGFFSDGPWDAKLLDVENEPVSLNDIEHRILRPIWQDNRIHYAVNCASIGCPNLEPEAYTARNTERLLENGARTYVNHPRGARIDGETLTVSSIYEWFQVDFGGSRDGVIEHLLRYAEKPLARDLQGVKGRMKNRYDWSLNK